MRRFGHAVKHLWPLDEEMIFLNHGSYGACPISVLKAQQAWRDKLEAQPCQFINAELPTEIRNSATALANFIHAHADDTVLVENTTCGINAVLKSLTFEAGSNVLALDHIYNAIRNTLRFVLEPQGCKLIEVPIGLPVLDEATILASLEAAITPQTKLLVIDHIASITAVRMPVEKIAELARSRGIPILVDAAHAPGMIDLDVPSLGVDYYVGNCHKWLCAPKGAAFLWARSDVQEGLHPTVISHDLGQGFTREFDKIGTRDPSSWLSIPDALSFHQDMGGSELRKRNRDMAIQTSSELAQAWGTQKGAPEEMFGSMATVQLPGKPPATRDFCEQLKRHIWQHHKIEAHVMPFAGQQWCRISIQAYNEPSDVQALGEVMPAALSSLMA